MTNEGLEKRRPNNQNNPNYLHSTTAAWSLVSESGNAEAHTTAPHTSVTHMRDANMSPGHFLSPHTSEARTILELQFGERIWRIDALNGLYT